MKNLNFLVNLINKLNKEELKSLLKYLKYYNEKNSSSKSLELINIILNSNNYNALTIKKQLYKGVNNFAFNKLIERLKDKILEVLLFNSNISNDNYSERVKVIFDLKKKLIQCDILSLKGLRDDGDLLCRKIISKAEKYELYDIVMNAQIIRQRFISIRKKQADVIDIHKNIQLAENKQKSVLNSQNIYNSILNKINIASDSNSYINELKSAINVLEEEFKLYHTDIVSYYLFFLKIEFFQIQEKYNEAEAFLIKINSLLSKKSIYSDNRKGTTLLNISNNMIYLNKFDDAILYANESREYFKNNVFNQALVEEYLFYANFYKGNLKEASININKLINLPKANNVLFSINKWNYFNAVLDFVKKDFQNSISKLNTVIEITKDKEGWNINKRLMLIMCRIELKQYESVDLQINNLEKFIKRSLKKRDIRLRYIYLLRIFLKLINSNYNFNQVCENRKRYFQLLDSDDINLKWKINSPELIKIDDWFRSQFNRKNK